MMGFLDGYRVVNLSAGPAGGHAGRRLAELGAEVVRAAAPDGDGPSRAAVLGLARRADVLLHDVPPSHAERRGVAYPALRAANPRLVCVALPGGGSPPPPGAHAVSEAVLGALLRREHTGEGRLVALARTPAAEPPYGVFPTKDGHLALALPPLAALGDALDLPELGSHGGHGGHSCHDEVTALIRLRLPRRTTAEWLAAFAERGIGAEPVTALPQHPRARGKVLTPLTGGRPPAGPPRPDSTVAAREEAS